MDSAMDHAPPLHSFYSTHSEGKVVRVVLLETLLLSNAITYSSNHHFIIMAQRYVDSTIDDLSMMDMGEC